MRYTDFVPLARGLAVEARHYCHAVVAIALKGGAVQGYAVNAFEAHAEVCALKKFPSATTLFVYRFNTRHLASKENRDSCPCDKCAAALTSSNVRKVWFLHQGRIVSCHPKYLGANGKKPWLTWEPPALAIRDP